MLHRLAVIAIVLAAAAFATVLVLENLPGPNQGGPSADEGWRRTKSGWELLSPTVVSTLPSAHPVGDLSHKARSNAGAKPAPRMDFHPAVLALLILLGAISGYSLFPNERSAAFRRQSQSLF